MKERQTGGKRDRHRCEEEIHVLMCCSDIRSFRGGMVTVVKNYLEYDGWKRTEIRFIPTHKSGGNMTKILCFAVALFKIIALFSQKKVDVVHLHMSERGSFYRKAILTRLCCFFHTAVILHHHGAEFEDFYEKLGKGGKRYVRRILEMADCNLVLSQSQVRELKKKAPSARVRVLHNAIHTEAKRCYNTKASGIIMLGYQGRRKGTYDLVEAVAQIRDRIPEDCRLWLCGDGEVDAVKERIRSLGMEKMVAHIGWIEGEQKEACLREAAVHVLPSYREVLPMSILETMGRGIPNISTKIAAIPEVITDGKDGVLIEPGEIERLGEKLLWLLQDEKLRETMSRNAYRRVQEEFSLESCAKRLEKLYEELAEA